MGSTRTFSAAQIAGVVAEAKDLQERESLRKARDELSGALEERILEANPDAIPEKDARRIARELASNERVPQEYLDRVLRARYPSLEEHAAYIEKTAAALSPEVLEERMFDRINGLAAQWGERIVACLSAHDPSARYTCNLLKIGEWYRGPAHVRSHFRYHAQGHVEKMITSKRRRRNSLLRRLFSGKKETVDTITEKSDVCLFTIAPAYTGSEQLWLELQQSRGALPFKEELEVKLNSHDPVMSVCADTIAALREQLPSDTVYENKISFDPDKISS